MRVSRSFAIKILYVLDNWVPPRVRDSKWFMYLPMRLVLKDVTRDFMSFKDDVFSLAPAEFAALYERTAHVQQLQGETDLNALCEEEILTALRSRRVLEVGCGRGYLADALQRGGREVTACDIVLAEGIAARYPNVVFQQANLQELPFTDDSFDAVVCTHTLEHVQDLPRALHELRRVAKDELVIVVPRQRPYKYAFNLHTQFFPYAWSLQGAFGYREDAIIKDLGDWYYAESDPHN